MLRQTAPFSGSQILLLPAFLFLFLAPVLEAQQGDQLASASIGDGGCYDLTLINGNAAGQLIDRLTMRILTPGSLWYDRIKAPASWTLDRPAPESLDFSTSSAAVRPGGKLLLSTICLDPVCAQPTTIKVLWQTFLANSLITSDTLLLDCTPLQVFDTVSVRDSSGLILATLHNRNSTRVILNGLSIASVTHGVTMSVRSNNSWIVSASTDTTAVFASTTEDLQPGASLSGFVIDPDVDASAVPPYVFRWSARSLLRTISSGEFTYGSAVVGDSVRWLPLRQSPGQDINLQDLVLRNLHRPIGVVDRVRFEAATPGVRFSDVSSGPWARIMESPTAVRFHASTPLPIGDSLAGVTLAMTNVGTRDTVRILWQTYTAGKVVYRDSADLYCPPSVLTVCDSFSLSKGSGCTASLRILNRHQPTSPLNGLSLEIVGNAEDILSVVPPAGWTLDSLRGSTAHLRHDAAGLASGAISDPFLLEFSSQQAGTPFFLTLRSSYEGRVLCEETSSLTCEEGTVDCDSLVLHQLDSRAYLFQLYNTHQPASTITAITLSAPSKDVLFGQIGLPDGWIQDSASAGYFRAATGTGFPPGGNTSADFAFRFTDNQASTVTLRLCSIDTAGVICCQTVTLDLPPWRSCDSLDVIANKEDCSADLRLYNVHGLGTTITALGIQTRTPGRIIDTAFAPSGWKVERLSADHINIIPRTHDGLSAGSALFGLSVRFGPAGETGEVEFEWVTHDSFSVICSNRATIDCAPAVIGCDSVYVEADTSAPCCFELAITNLREQGAEVDSVRLRILTPGVIIYPSTVTTPFAWKADANEGEISWSTTTFPIHHGEELSDFHACFDNDAIGNAAFTAEISSYDAGDAVCVDTVLLQCGQTLRVPDPPAPSRAALEVNFPNPFSATTTLTCALDRRGYVRLEVLDATGRVLSVAMEGFMDAGRYTAVFDASALPPGVYFARLRTGGQQLLRAMTRIR